jgi:hypothetical protein
MTFPRKHEHHRDHKKPAPAPGGGEAPERPLDEPPPAPIVDPPPDDRPKPPFVVR